jgi:hypothetical protein
MAAPYTAEELAAIRELSEYEDMMGLGARRLLATIDAVTAERDALREAVRALVEALDVHGVKACEECEALATRYLLSCITGDTYLCDSHAKDRLARETPAPLQAKNEPVAAPLRALRALLGGDR